MKELEIISSKLGLVNHHHQQLREQRMGNCLTGDVAGGKQAIGGVQQRPTSTATTNNAAQNDAVDFFFRSRGQYPLFSQIEVSLSKKKTEPRVYLCVCVLSLTSSL